MATRLRHIAIIVPDPETAAQFFEQAFGMTRAGSGRRGIYMSDGVMNVALLKRETDDERIGLYHFGMWVDDLAESEKKVFDAGGTYLAGRPTSPNSYYEAKYKDPLGVVFDLTHTGWIGAVKEVVAKDAPAAAGLTGHAKEGPRRGRRKGLNRCSNLIASSWSAPARSGFAWRWRWPRRASAAA